MTTVLPFLIPPIAGAIIGYVTNAIAIKMLFRPLGEKRLFGIRIPFTPGILPKQRHILAQSIGRMVERELLTPEILRERLSRGEVIESLKNIITDHAYPQASKAIIAFLNNREIRETMESQFRIMITKTVLEMNLLQRFFVSAGQYDKTIEDKIPLIIDELVNQLEKIFESEEGREKIINAIENELSKTFRENPEQKLKNILENILKTINVKTLVSERIDSLDMLRVEKMILDVLAGQLWWINVFGGILGFLIGCFQVFISRFY